MLELLPTLIPLLIVDALNPVLFALMIIAVGEKRPVVMSLSLLIGHTSAYFFSGVIIALALEQIAYRLAHPLPVDYLIQLVLGALCLWAALGSRGGKASEERTPARELTPLFCFGYGAMVNFIAVPFALPYFAAVDRIVKAELSTPQSLLALALYNLVYALPFMLVPLLSVMMGQAGRRILTTINNGLVRIVDILMPILLLGLGLVLIVDAALVLVRGEGIL
jgi:cytochrome c biogenesis protein CcdA